MKPFPDRYGKHYSEKALRKKLRILSSKAYRKLLEHALILYVLLTQSETPPWAKGLIVAALGYLICPLDVIPDIVPGAGYADDLGVLVGLILLLKSQITPEVREHVRQLMESL